SLTDLILTLLPRIELHGRIVFRQLHCLHQRQEAVAEMTGLGWKWCVRLQERGKDPAGFPGALVAFAARAVKSRRRLCGCEKPRDVLSRRAQRGHDFTVAPLHRGAACTVPCTRRRCTTTPRRRSMSRSASGSTSRPGCSTAPTGIAAWSRI